MDDELKNIAPELAKLRPQKEAFKLPDGYFETVEARVMGRIGAAGLQGQAPLKLAKKPARRIALPHYIMAAAAAVALVLAAVWFFNTAPAPPDSTASVELSEEDIEAYLLENVQYLELDQLAMLPGAAENEYQPPVYQEKTSPKNAVPDEITPEDVEHLLNDMTEEELEEIL